MTVEPYRMVEPQTLTDAELRRIYQRKDNMLKMALKLAFWTLVVFVFVIAILIIRARS